MTVAIDTGRVTRGWCRGGRGPPHMTQLPSWLVCHFHTDSMASRDAASKSIILDGRGLVLSILSLSGGDLPACGDVTGSPVTACLHGLPFPSHRCSHTWRDVPVGARGGLEAGTNTTEAHRARAGVGGRGTQAARTLSLSEPSCWPLRVKPWRPFSLVLFAWDLPITTTPEDCTCVFV